MSLEQPFLQAFVTEQHPRNLDIKKGDMTFLGGKKATLEEPSSRPASDHLTVEAPAAFKPFPQADSRQTRRVFFRLAKIE